LLWCCSLAVLNGCLRWKAETERLEELCALRLTKTAAREVALKAELEDKRLAEVAALEDQVRLLQTGVCQLQQNVPPLERRIGKLEGYREDLTAECAEKKAMIAKLNLEADTLQNELDETTKSRDKADDEVASTKGWLMTEKNRSLELSTELSELKREYIKVRDENEKKEVAGALAEEEDRQSKTAIKSAIRQLEMLQQEMQNALRDAKAAKLEVNRLRQVERKSIEVLQKTIKDHDMMANQLPALMFELKTTRQMIEECQLTMARQSTDIAKLQAELQMMQGEKELTEEELAETKAALEIEEELRAAADVLCEAQGQDILVWSEEHRHELREKAMLDYEVGELKISCKELTARVIKYEADTSEDRLSQVGDHPLRNSCQSVANQLPISFL
jgi:chromosome segregation ATPase